jgi:hypothetical protein
MQARRAKRIRSRASKSKCALQRPGKRGKTLRRVIPDDDDIARIGPTHSLLLSSLKFWEVERDLIEERVAALSR